MIICNGVLTLKEVEQFRAYWENNQKSSYINWIKDDKILDRRLIIEPDSSEMKIISRICSYYFTDIKQIYTAYQRQNFAHQIHIDDYGSDQNDFVYTFVLSLNTEPRFKTIVWKERCHSNHELHEYVSNWGQTRHTLDKKTNISQEQDLEHTYDENQQDYMCDYLDLDGIYSYEAGNGVLFSAKQFHCTSNWTKYNDISYRDLLQIHVITPIELDC